MLKLYNTATRSMDDFNSIQPGRVGLYTCGPTVYNYAHIGNLRTYIFEDILKRVLVRRGYEVFHVMNITDVGHLTDDADLGEDKMELGAKREGRTVWDVAEHYTKAFQADCVNLEIGEPQVWCRATEHIAEQIAMVRGLEKKGYTYSLEDGIYFDTSRFPGYGAMAGLDLQGLMAGIRVEQVAGKRSASDFCVWKFSPPDQQRLMEWDSPWGRGFPGWHLECSAMALKYLGERFDIHCGGVDHVRVHHTNEIAQTEAVTGKPWVRWWMHGEFLLLDEGKMSKSADNFLTLPALVKKGFDPLAYRLFLLSAHYRKALSFNFEALSGAQKALERLRLRTQKLLAVPAGAVNSLYMKAFEEALDDDLNMPKAVSQMWLLLQDEAVPDGEKRASLESMEQVLQIRPFATPQEGADISDERILALIAERNQARQDKNYKRSDDIRAELLALGISIKDGPQGTQFSRLAGR